MFFGHPNITAKHEMTIEVTKAKDLTPRGDCIIGVSANKACYDLPDALKRRLRSENVIVTMSVIVDDNTCSFFASGSPDLVLTHKHDIVIRKSRFVCPRTVAVRCDKASSNLPKDLIQRLRDPSSKGILVISTE